MSDTDTVDPGTTAEQQTAAESLKPAEAAKPPKPVAQPHGCLCQTYELVGIETIGDKPEEVTYQSECGLTTKSTFAQGHDARLVSFLVDGHRDGYSIRQTVNSVATSFATPAQAVSHVSEKLKDKAEKATANMQAKQAAKNTALADRAAKKAERDAAAAAKKASAAEAKKAEPKNTGEVVAGSTTGDVAPLVEGQIRIKAGRWEYVATKNEDGGVTFVDGKGETQVRAEGDGYTVLEG